MAPHTRSEGRSPSLSPRKVKNLPASGPSTPPKRKRVSETSNSGTKGSNEEPSPKKQRLLSMFNYTTPTKKTLSSPRSPGAGSSKKSRGSPQDPFRSPSKKVKVASPLKPKSPRSFTITFIDSGITTEEEIESDDKPVFYATEAQLSKNSYFRAICKGDFKETETGTINFPKADPETIRHVLEYINTNELEQEIKSGKATPETYADLFQAADMYDVSGMKCSIIDVVMGMKGQQMKVLHFVQCMHEKDLHHDAELGRVKTAKLRALLPTLNKSQKSELDSMLAEEDKEFIQIITDGLQSAARRKVKDEHTVRTQIEAVWHEITNWKQAWRRKKRQLKKRDDEAEEWLKQSGEGKRQILELKEEVAELKESLKARKTKYRELKLKVQSDSAEDSSTTDEEASDDSDDSDSRDLDDSDSHDSDNNPDDVPSAIEEIREIDSEADSTGFSADSDSDAMKEDAERQNAEVGSDSDDTTDEAWMSGWE